jgi:hypothetical protein
VVSGCSLKPLACFGEFDLDRVLGGLGGRNTKKCAGLGLSSKFTFPLPVRGQRAADLLTELRDGSFGSFALGDTFGPNLGGFRGREARQVGAP